jgi:hypothetical protein
MYNTRNHNVFLLCPPDDILKNTEGIQRFGNRLCFNSQMKGVGDTCCVGSGRNIQPQSLCQWLGVSSVEVYWNTARWTESKNLSSPSRHLANTRSVSTRKYCSLEQLYIRKTVLLKNHWWWRWWWWLCVCVCVYVCGVGVCVPARARVCLYLCVLRYLHSADQNDRPLSCDVLLCARYLSTGRSNYGVLPKRR